MTDTRKVSYVFLLVFYRDVKSQRIAAQPEKNQAKATSITHRQYCEVSVDLEKLR